MKILFEIVLMGALAGGLASYFIGKSRNSFGLLNYIIIGMLGSFLGRFLFDFLGLSPKSEIGTFIMTLSGAFLLVWLMNVVNRKI